MAPASSWSAAPVNRRSIGFTNDSGRPLAASRRPWACSATAWMSAMMCRCWWRSAGRSADSLASKGTVSIPSSPATIPPVRSSQASTSSSSSIRWASSGFASCTCTPEGQSSRSLSTDCTAASNRLTNSGASSPESTSNTGRGACRASMSMSAVRRPSVLARASTGYIAIGIRRVTKSVLRSRTNSSRSRWATARILRQRSLPTALFRLMAASPRRPQRTPPRALRRSPRVPPACPVQQSCQRG